MSFCTTSRKSGIKFLYFVTHGRRRNPQALFDVSNLAQHSPRRQALVGRKVKGDGIMSVGLILLIILIIFLLGGFSGRFGGYGYGYGHGGVGVIGIILIIVVVLMLLGRI
jgi:uncharacterized protein DUF3309